MRADAGQMMRICNGELNNEVATLATAAKPGPRLFFIASSQQPAPSAFSIHRTRVTSEESGPEPSSIHASGRRGTKRTAFGEM